MFLHWNYMQIQAKNELSGWFRFGREGVTDEEIVQVRNIAPFLESGQLKRPF